jgi:hypothetical protein
VEESAEFQRIEELEEKTRERIANTEYKLGLDDIIAQRESIQDEEDPAQEAMGGDDGGRDEESWREELKEDPYVIESGHILDDLTELM